MMLRRLMLGLACGSAFALPIRAADSVPDFSGAWARTTFGLESPKSGPGPVKTMSRRSEGQGNFNVADEHSPILKPAASAAVKRRNDAQAAGIDPPTPSNHCLPMAVPYAFRVQGMQFLQQKNQVVILYMQDHQMRHIRLNAQHPAKVAPSWYGDSVGHYEGDTLVVDTIGFKAGPYSHVDSFGTPFSTSLHVVERYRLIDYETAKAEQDRNVRENGDIATTQAAAPDPNYRGPGLQVQFTVEDGTYFTTPWSGAATYRKAGAAWVENVCAENTHEYYANKDTEVPTANRPDF